MRSQLSSNVDQHGDCAVRVRFFPARVSALSATRITPCHPNSPPPCRPTIRFRNYTPRDSSIGETVLLTRAELPSEISAAAVAERKARENAADVSADGVHELIVTPYYS